MPELRRYASLAVIALLTAALARGGEPDGTAPDGDGKSGRVSVELTGGDLVEGTLLRRDEEHIYVYVGGSVVKLEQSKVKTIKTGDGDGVGVEAEKEFELYKTGRLPIKNVQVLVEKLGPAIVVVKTPSGLGTGWFCNREGYLITNNHVIAGERSITVTMFHKKGDGFGKETFKKVRIVALNDDLDLALLKVEDQIDIEYPQLYIGDSTALEEGDKCFAVGNPLGLERSISEGSISKAARNQGGRLYIQTTAPIAPGNSGGPLFNERGEVVGVVNMGYIYFDGLGFAIPSKYIKEFLDNVEAFAYDEDNPNTGIQYMETPVTSTDGKIKLTASDFIKVGHGISCLTLADLNGDGVQEVVFANNNKSEIGVARLRKAGEAGEEGGAEDFEDINRLKGSRLFTVDTVPVASRISSLAVSDLNGDERPDIVFYGDIDGLAVLAQKEDGTFKAARKIDDVTVAQRRGAVRVVDIDADGKKDILVLGPEAFTLFRGGSEREEFPLNGAYRSGIKNFELLDANGDGRLDLVFFALGKHYAVYVRLQNAEGKFVEEFPIASHLSGPVHLYRRGEGIRFLTLDTGLNRVRELVLGSEKAAPGPGRVASSLLALPVDPGIDALVGADGFEMADTDGDGKLEILTLDRKKNAFVIHRYGQAGFAPVRSPSPRDVSACRLYAGKDGRGALFSLSKKDKIFGISRVEEGKVSFPRPLNTEGEVELMRLASLDGGPVSLLWIEKLDSSYYLRSAPAEKLLASVFDGAQGSIDVEAATLSFGPEEDKLKEELPKKPADLAFGDFNADGRTDVVIYWSYSGKESLYLGLGEGRFREIIKEQNFLDEQKGQPLIVEDIDADGKKDVLLVKPEFVRVLKVDDKGKLYVARQFNWEFEAVSQFIPYETADGRSRFLTVSGRNAEIVELDAAKGKFKSMGRLDLSGLDLGSVKVGDVDGNGRPDLVMFGSGAIFVSLNKPEIRTVDSRVVMSAKLDHFRYWNLRPADLDGDGADEVMLFDSAKTMFEIYRPEADGSLKLIFRHRLFERTIFQRAETDAYEMPQELEIGDVDGNGKPDLVCILQDRVAVYLQGDKK